MTAPAGRTLSEHTLAAGGADIRGTAPGLCTFDVPATARRPDLRPALQGSMKQQYCVQRALAPERCQISTAGTSTIAAPRRHRLWLPAARTQHHRQSSGDLPGSGPTS